MMRDNSPKPVTPGRPSTPTTVRQGRSHFAASGSPALSRKRVISVRRKTPNKQQQSNRVKYSPAKKSPDSTTESSLKMDHGNAPWKQEPVLSDSYQNEESFQDHADLCKRMAKSFYFAKIPTTPRPSLPLTVLAVSTFGRAARKDTLEYLDLDMAAEIGRNACVSPTALIMALVYLERLSAQNPGYLKTIKPSELFVVSLLVASKFIQDDGEDLGIFNDEWATSAQMELKKLNALELEFLSAIDWKINVGRLEYDKVLTRLETKLAVEEGTRRGWFTYTELGNLTDSFLAWNVIWPTLYDQCLKVISAAYLMYATVLATILTSSLLAPQLLMMSKLFLTQSISSLAIMDGTASYMQCCGVGVSTSNSSAPASRLWTDSGNFHAKMGDLDEEEEDTGSELFSKFEKLNHFRKRSYGFNDLTTAKKKIDRKNGIFDQQIENTSYCQIRCTNNDNDFMDHVSNYLNQHNEEGRLTRKVGKDLLDKLTRHSFMQIRRNHLNIRSLA